MKLLFFILSFLFAESVWALPLYEFGVAGGVGYLPDYPGSNEGQVRRLVLPNVRYRGKVFRADENGGVRAKVFEYKALDFDFSFGGAFPVNSGDNSARRDMQPLDWLVEFGPRVMTTLWFETNVGRVRLALPFRAVFSTDVTSFTYEGTVAVPGVIAEKFLWPCKSCRTIVTLGSSFASQGVGEYFYQVSEKDVTESRKAYDARGGYMGTDLTFGIAYFHKRVQLIFGARASSYQGSVNERSPLFKSNENLAGFLAVGWMFYQSKEMAE